MPVIILLKKKEKPLKGRADSFVVETNVHFPTDINLLFDAMRKVISLIGPLSLEFCLNGWRQWSYNVKDIKRQMRIIHHKKRSGARIKAEGKKEKQEAVIKEAHQSYIDNCQIYLNKARKTLFDLNNLNNNDIFKRLRAHSEIEGFIRHADRQIDQIKRRVINGEMIPHAEKVFSIFEPHTEWIVKGKVGVPVELGVKVCIIEDQYQFILHHEVMQKKTDDQIAVSFIKETQSRFPQLKTCSFDKGFHSIENQEELSKLLEVVGLPRKGKLSKQAQLIESSKEFKEARDKHSAVESAINALEVHGLDRCPDHGIDGFKKYVALAMVAQNIQRIGAILKRQDRKKIDRKMKKQKREYERIPIAA